MILCFAQVTGQNGMFVHAVWGLGFFPFLISLCDLVLSCTAKTWVHSSSYQTWYEHWSNTVLHALSVCCDAASAPTVITLARSHSVCCLHKIDLVHTWNNSLARLSDWNLQGSQQSGKNKKKKCLLLKCSHLSNGSILEELGFGCLKKHIFFWYICCLFSPERGCIWSLRPWLDDQSRDFAWWNIKQRVAPHHYNDVWHQIKKKMCLTTLQRFLPRFEMSIVHPSFSTLFL